jgi:hypothetical protein
VVAVGSTVVVVVRAGSCGDTATCFVIAHVPVCRAVVNTY